VSQWKSTNKYKSSFDHHHVVPNPDYVSTHFYTTTLGLTHNSA